MGPELRDLGRAWPERDLSYGDSGAGLFEWEVGHGLPERWVVVGEQSQRTTTRKALVVATETEIDGGCNEWTDWWCGRRGRV